MYMNIFLLLLLSTVNFVFIQYR